MGQGHRAERPLNGAVRVVPDVPSFAVDDGFVYSVPDGLTLGVGDVVRVPLGGRRVRGWVIGGATGRDRRLRPVLARSGEIAVFDVRMLGVLRWAAAHYVAPLASLLGKVTPPNLPRRRSPVAPASGDGSLTHRADDRPVRVWMGAGPWHGPIGELARRMTAGGRSVLVVAPTWAEAEALARSLDEIVPGRVLLASSHLPAAEVTAAWVEAATVAGRVVVGTRETAWWRAPSIGAAVVVGEGRRGMKDKATPTVHARDVLLKRGSVERFPVVLCEVVPTAEALLKVSDVESPLPGRLWGLVEVVDRRRDAIGGALLGDTATAAIRAARAEGRRVLVFTHRRAAAQRCVRCRALRRCASCGAAPGSGAACARCDSAVGPCPSCGGTRFEAMGSGVARLVGDVARITGPGVVGEAGSGSPVVVGTERDLPGLEVDLCVVVDADGLLLAPTYRAAEDGLRLLARAVASAGRGRGRRAIVQTMQPDHPAVVALRRADPIPFVRADAEERSRLAFPPGGELLAVEAQGLSEAARDELREAVAGRATVLGPEATRGGLRWLLQARDLSPARVVLRSIVGRWREGGARVRIDADPLDL